MNEKIPEIERSQLYYGKTSHIIIIISCVISLLAPVFIIVFPNKNILDPYLIFNAVFEGKPPAMIWEAAGVSFESENFWKYFSGKLFTPDGFALFGIALGCSVSLWAMIPAIWQYLIKREYLYVFISLFIILLIAFAISGLKF